MFEKHLDIMIFSLWVSLKILLTQTSQ